jgi:L-lactate permease
VYQQVYDPIAGSLVLSTLVAVIPIVVLVVLLAGIRMAAQWAALITLAVALVLAMLVYGMPVGLAIDSALFGTAFGLFPIVWIVINAIFIYNVLMSFWSPSSEWHFEHEPPSAEREDFETPPLGRTLYAWSPFIIIVALFLIVQIGPIKDATSATQLAINFPSAVISDTTGLPVVPWPGLDGNVAQTAPVVPKPTPYDAVFSTNWLSAAGTIILIGDIISLAVLRVGPGPADRAEPQPDRRCQLLRWRPGEDDQPAEPRRGHERHGPAGQGGRPPAPGIEVVYRPDDRDVHTGGPPGLRIQVHGPVGGLWQQRELEVHLSR